LSQKQLVLASQVLKQEDGEGTDPRIERGAASFQHENVFENVYMNFIKIRLMLKLSF
jgi:hypothetical protein